MSYKIYIAKKSIEAGQYLCESDGCDSKATFIGHEVIKDEDGTHSYYAFWCDEHVSQNQYQEVRPV